MKYLAFVLLPCLLVAACGDDDDDATNNGVNDVTAACQIRAAWTQANSEKCVQCQTTAPLQRCDCEALAEFSGACFAQGEARRAEPTCTRALDDCVRACKGECGCVDGCYAEAAACKTRAAALDGCVADTCRRHCE